MKTQNAKIIKCMMVQEKLHFCSARHDCANRFKRDGVDEAYRVDFQLSAASFLTDLRTTRASCGI